ncbi:MAG: patatin-like phospholipase family protein [Sulfurimonas sp.]|nr:patatin-like phospholipase family protein [Sulfurimonas sp.]
MKIFIVLLLTIGFSFADTRPKIALVLSGGGARGGAHVGVLKVLEKNNIPIDLIVGTSMGAFVGGLYASGMSADEIKEMLITTNWEENIRTDFDRKDTPMRTKEVEYTYQGRLGLGVNVKNEIVLPTGVLKRQPMLMKFSELTEDSRNIKDFDNLPIPFRAVATNIVNGEAVVLKSGSLAKSIYASSSIPGGFQPILIDGIDLVDGGISDNIPIQTAKDMGADIIIAVDVSENFEDDIDVNSYFVVLGQMVNILMRKNANESIKKLTDKDILITPELDGFTGLDVQKYPQIIKRGLDATNKIYATKLKYLSMSDEDYSKYKKDHRVFKKVEAPIIDAIEIVNQTYISDESILKRLKVKVGDRLDRSLLRQNLMHIYNMTIFDSVEYDIKELDGKNTLVIITTPSWNNHGEMNFAFGIEDDSKGHSAYSLKFGYTKFGINSLGAEWKNDFEIGKRQKAYTEFFQPLDTTQRYYVKPALLYENILDLVPIQEGKKASAELESRRYGASFSAGAYINTYYQFEVGIGAYKDHVVAELIDDSGEDYNARPIYASISVDNLDDLNFPDTGLKSTIEITKEMKELGSDYEHTKIYLDLEKPLSVYNNNFTTYIKAGTVFNNHNDPDKLMLNDMFVLGGLFNMSGYAPYSLIGNHMFLGVVKYRYRIKDGGFFGSLDTPLYAGFSLEAGDAWDDGMSESLSDVKKSGTVYGAADTFLGPLYLAFGFAQDGSKSFYLYLGEKF